MSTVDEIKERIDIVELISEYVPNLKKAGHNYRALCPFHSETTPSFFVFPDRQSWHCFGSCSTGGDIFAFVMKKENVDFGEALTILAQKAGVTLPSERHDNAADKERNELYEINRKAAEYYNQILLTSATAGTARNYLAKRGVSGDSIQSFLLGFSPNNWDTIKNIFSSQGKLRQGLTTGLIIEKDGGGYYDRFRGQLMFPIRNIRGNITGFGARVLDDSLPKYINSPQSIIFDKSSELYGIDRSHDTINKLKKAVIVEGYMDVIIAHQYGFTNVVASMSTTFTLKQAVSLKRLTKNILLAMDADKAGSNAPTKDLASVWLTRDIIDSLMKEKDKRSSGGHYSEEYVVKVMSLPPGKDPDEVIKENKSNWQKLVDTAPGWKDFVVDIITSKINPNDAKSKSNAVDEVLPFLMAIPDPIERATYRQKLARVVGVNENDLIEAIKKFTDNKAVKINKIESKNIIRKTSSGNPREDYCLSLLLHYPVLKGKTLNIRPEYFSHTENREVFLLWQRNDNIDSMTNIDTPLQEQLDNLMNKVIPPMSDTEIDVALNDCIRHLREQYLRDMKIKESMLYSDPEISINASDLEEIEIKGLNHNTQLRDIFNNNHE